MFYGNVPNITAMVEAGLDLMLGTDNAMITPPNMLEEIAFAFRCAKLTGGISPEKLLEIAFRNPREVFEPDLENPNDPLQPGNSANFIVMNIRDLGDYSHPENMLCLGLSQTNIDLISIEKFIWRRLK